MSSNLYSYLKFEVLIVFILSNTNDVVDFVSPSHNIYKNHNISLIRVGTLQYLLEDCVFVLFCFAVFVLNGMSLMSTLYTYSLQPVFINQCCSVVSQTKLSSTSSLVLLALC